MRRWRPWQWLLIVLVFYVAVTEAVRIWAGLVWAERIALLIGGGIAWAFINGRFVFAFYHAFVASMRVRHIPLWEPKAERLLVLAPHPDDEVLAAGGLMYETLRRGGQVRVVYLTSGDGFDLATTSPLNPKALRLLALRRMEEAREGAKVLGLSPSDLYFLGFPDQGLYDLLTTHYLLPYKSPHTELSRVAYPGVIGRTFLTRAGPWRGFWRSSFGSLRRIGSFCPVPWMRTGTTKRRRILACGPRRGWAWRVA